MGNQWRAYEHSWTNYQPEERRLSAAQSPQGKSNKGKMSLLREGNVLFSKKGTFL
jgi:hypothetical protein